jgi:kynurenine 3-monooxygenase
MRRLLALTICLVNAYRGIESFSPQGLRPQFPIRSQRTGLVRLPSSILRNDFARNAKQYPAPDEVIDAVVCGGGPAGLLTAIMLAEKFDKCNNMPGKIHVYDRLSPPPLPNDPKIWSDVAKFYLIGLGSRGQNALDQFGVWKNVVEKQCVAVRGRHDWSPESKSDEGTIRIFTKKDKPVTTQVLPRDKLVGCLYQHILETPELSSRIELHYGSQVTPLAFDYPLGSDSGVLLQIDSVAADSVSRERPTNGDAAAGMSQLDGGSSSVVAAKLLVAADGTIRTVANAMEKADQDRLSSLNPLRRLVSRVIHPPFRVRRYVDDNQRIYKTIPMKVPPAWRGDLNYSARTKGGRINFDALPANSDSEFCGVLLLKKDDPLANANTDAAELRERLDEALPQFSKLLSDDVVAAVAQKPVSYLPGFRYVGPRLRQGDRTLILGDCAHTVKPYFGLGANSALGDVKILGDIIDAQLTDPNGDKLAVDLTAAVHEFSRRQSGEAKALVKISRDLDRPGKLGFVTFILPLILDSIFHGLMPKVFAPNIIAMLQRDDYTFRRVARRKRMDRIIQVAIIGSALTGAAAAALFSLRLFSRLVGQSVPVLGASSAAVVAIAVLLNKAAKFFVPGSAPADILIKLLSKKVVNSRDHVTPLGKLYRKPETGKPIVGEIDAEDIASPGENNVEVANGESFLTPLGFGNKRRELVSTK